jgi:multidrug efflux system membrane fusion protein
VNTRLLVKTFHSATLIPTNAIQHNGQASFVYAIYDGAAHMQPVKTGVVDAGMTAVENIRPGTVVATSSFERLQDNAPVTAMKKPLPAGRGKGGAP